MEIYNRVIINTQDVMQITGRGTIYSRRLLCKIREHLDKPGRSLITIDEFCAYINIKESSLRAIMK